MVGAFPGLHDGGLFGGGFPVGAGEDLVDLGLTDPCLRRRLMLRQDEGCRSEAR